MYRGRCAEKGAILYTCSRKLFCLGQHLTEWLRWWEAAQFGLYFKNRVFRIFWEIGCEIQRETKEWHQVISLSCWFMVGPLLWRMLGGSRRGEGRVDGWDASQPCKGRLWERSSEFRRKVQRDKFGKHKHNDGIYRPRSGWSHLRNESRKKKRRSSPEALQHVEIRKRRGTQQETGVEHQVN